MNDLDLGQVDVCGWRLASQLLDYYTSAVDVGLALIVTLEVFVLNHRINRSSHLIVGLVHSLQVAVLWIDHVEAGGEEGIGLIWYGDHV